MKMAPYGRCVVLTTADLTKELFTASTEIAGNGVPNLGNVPARVDVRTGGRSAPTAAQAPGTAVPRAGR